MSAEISDEDRLFDLMRNGDVEALERFRQDNPGRPVDAYPWTLDDAVDCCAAPVIAWFLKNGADPNRDAGDGYSPLHSAIDREFPDRAEVIALLLDHGADVNQRGSNDWTPLHRAACSDRATQEILALLIDRGADRTARTGIDNFATPAEEAHHLGKDLVAAFIREHVPSGGGGE